MKRTLRTAVTFAAAAAMMMASVMTANATAAAVNWQGETEWKDTVMETPYADAVNGAAVNGFRYKVATIVHDEENDVSVPGEMHIAANVLSQDEYFASLQQKQDGEGWDYFCAMQIESFTSMVPEGYEWKFVVGDYSSFDLQQNYRDCWWWYVCDGANISNWKDIEFNFTNGEFFYIGNFNYVKKFTVNYNGMDYTECKLLYGSECDDMGRYSLYFAVLLPQNFGEANLSIVGGKLENGEVVMDNNSFIMYPLVTGVPQS